jgi:methylthioribulose-1-phosphate dehydratase
MTPPPLPVPPNPTSRPEADPGRSSAANKGSGAELCPPGSSIPRAPAGLGAALCAAIADLHRRGWCDGTGGNFSCVQQRRPLQLLMAPSGVDKGSVSPEELILVDADATVISGRGKASAETLLHLTIVEATGAGAVLHSHSQSGTLLSRHVATRTSPPESPPAASEVLELEGLEMLKGLEGVTTHATRVRIPVLANDQDLARLSRAARPLLASAPHGLLIAGHGLYAWGRDLAVARRHIEILEFLLEQHWRQLLLEAVTGQRS